MEILSFPRSFVRATFLSGASFGLVVFAASIGYLSVWLAGGNKLKNIRSLI